MDVSWSKSSHSANSSDCVEARVRGSLVQVRDSKDRNGPVLTFSDVEWRHFIDGIKNDRV